MYIYDSVSVNLSFGKHWNIYGITALKECVLGSMVTTMKIDCFHDEVFFFSQRVTQANQAGRMQFHAILVELVFIIGRHLHNYNWQVTHNDRDIAVRRILV